MSTTDRDTVETVAKLLAERKKVGEWLTALADRRGSTPPAVYQKVHDDYTAKLDKVQAKLVSASDAVQATAADLAARLTDKEEAVAKRRDERAEAELRYSVGEYSERDWEKRRAKLDDDIAVVTGERDTLRDELHRLRDVLAEVEGRVAPMGPGAAMPADAEALGERAYDSDAAEAAGAQARGYGQGASGAEPVPGGPEADSTESIVSGAIAAATELSSESIVPASPTIPIHEQSIIEPVEPAQPLAPSFDELAFLKSVVGRPTPVMGTRHPSEPALVPKRGAGDSKRPTPAQKRLPAEPPPASSRPTPVQSAEPVEANLYATPEPPMPFPDPVPEPRVSQEMTPPRESFFGRPTPRTSEAIKSLRCQECGTLNFPTEWYCERCGGELAAF